MAEYKGATVVVMFMFLFTMISLAVSQEQCPSERYEEVPSTSTRVSLTCAAQERIIKLWKCVNGQPQRVRTCHRLGRDATSELHQINCSVTVDTHALFYCTRANVNDPEDEPYKYFNVSVQFQITFEPDTVIPPDGPNTTNETPTSETTSMISTIPDTTEIVPSKTTGAKTTDTGTNNPPDGSGNTLTAVIIATCVVVLLGLIIFIAIVIVALMLYIKATAGDQPHAGGEPPAGDEPHAGREPPAEEQPPAGDQPHAEGEPPAGDQPHAGGEPPAEEQPPAGDQPPAGLGGEPPVEQNTNNDENAVYDQGGQNQGYDTAQLRVQQGNREDQGETGISEENEGAVSYEALQDGEEVGLFKMDIPGSISDCTEVCSEGTPCELQMTSQEFSIIARKPETPVQVQDTECSCTYVCLHPSKICDLQKTNARPHDSSLMLQGRHVFGYKQLLPSDSEVTGVLAAKVPECPRQFSLVDNNLETHMSQVKSDLSRIALLSYMFDDSTYIANRYESGRVLLSTGVTEDDVTSLSSPVMLEHTAHSSDTDCEIDIILKKEQISGSSQSNAAEEDKNKNIILPKLSVHETDVEEESISEGEHLQTMVKEDPQSVQSEDIDLNSSDSGTETETSFLDPIQLCDEFTPTVPVIPSATRRRTSRRHDCSRTVEETTNSKQEKLLEDPSGVVIASTLTVESGNTNNSNNTWDVCDEDNCECGAQPIPETGRPPTSLLTDSTDNRKDTAFTHQQTLISPGYEKRMKGSPATPNHHDCGSGKKGNTCKSKDLTTSTSSKCEVRPRESTILTITFTRCIPINAHMILDTPGIHIVY